MKSLSPLTFILAIVLISCAYRSGVVSTTSRLAELDPTLGRRLDSAIAAVVRDRDIPGASIALLHGDTVKLLRSYGFADRERRIPATPGTIYQLASTTKPFTAMAVMMLVEEGKVELDAPAARYVSWLPMKYGGITVRNLLNHTSGIAPDMRLANVDEMSQGEFRRRLDERPVSSAPAMAWQYANAGYTLLADIVETESGQSFGSFLQQRIFGPLGMSRSAYRADEQADSLHAVGYDISDGGLQRAPHVFSGWGNSGIESTAEDMARWVLAINRGDLLSPASYAAMVTAGRIAGDTAVNFQFRDSRSGYGFGWFLTSHRGQKLITHGGAIAGFSSIVHRFPSNGWSIVVLTNGKQGRDRQSQAEVLAQTIIDVAGFLPRP